MLCEQSSEDSVKQTTTNISEHKVLQKFYRITYFDYLGSICYSMLVPFYNKYGLKHLGCAVIGAQSMTGWCDVTGLDAELLGCLFSDKSRCLQMFYSSYTSAVCQTLQFFVWL